VSTESDSATVELLITVDPSAQDRLVAELDRLGFEAYLQDDDELRAYIPSSQWSATLDTQVRGLLSEIGLPPNARITVIPAQNWNQRWEDTIEPVAVGAFIVTPSWHRDQRRELGLIPLEIDPKMSFGTGYHATTRLILHMLPSVVRGGERVLDAGTGTGILAIAAARLGASFVLGVDIDPWSERNALETCERNGVADVVRIRLCDVGAVEETAFDVILANIQLDVIVRSFASLKSKLATGGRILVSGILLSQVNELTHFVESMDMHVEDSRVEDGWWAAALRSA